jgi:hypothetical protein
MSGVFLALALTLNSALFIFPSLLDLINLIFMYVMEITLAGYFLRPRIAD